MVAAAVDKVEETVRTLCLTKRLRPSEFFIDYDRLRSGYVTGKYFKISRHMLLVFVFEEQIFVCLATHQSLIFL